MILTTGATGPDVGECNSDDDCGKNQICLNPPIGTCACAVGFVLCGSECVDIRIDDSHCGRCKSECQVGGCANGVCGGLLPSANVGAPELLSGDDPVSECMFRNEGKPEESINYAADGISSFIAFQSDQALPGSNFSDLSSVWTSTPQSIPLLNGGVSDDPWTTTHGGTGLEYAVFIGTDDDGNPCVKIAATDAESLAAGIWTHPLTCANSNSDDPDSFINDGPMIVSDLGDDAIYIAYADIRFDVVLGSVRNVVLRRYAPCSGVPLNDGSENCPFDWERRIEQKSVGTQTNEHVNVVVNPCTHNPLVLYRRPKSANLPEDILLQAYDASTGEKLTAEPIVLDQGVPFEKNTDCGGNECPSDFEICTCGGVMSDTCTSSGTGCMDLAARVHGVATMTPDGVCRMVIAYDFSVSIEDGMMTTRKFMKSRMKSFTLSGDSPKEAFTLNSSDPSTSFNDFNGTVLHDYFSKRTGFFFYRQMNNNACDTRYMGWVSSNGINGFELIQVSDPFPSIRFDFTDGLGHYVEGARFTEPGVLFPSWSQPIQTAPPCQECMGMDFSLAVMGARISP